MNYGLFFFFWGGGMGRDFILLFFTQLTAVLVCNIYLLFEIAQTGT